MARKPRKPKRVSYELVAQADHPTMFKLLTKLVKAHHPELKHAQFALAWCTSWRADVDGHQKLGQCKKASDLDRELAEYDFVILLLRDFWTNPIVKDEQRAALLDHELCHAAVKLDPETGDPMEDERGRIVYRVRKHDLEEFAEIAERHGMWKRDIAHFAAALKRSKQQALPLEETPEQAPAQTH